jgi:glucose/galactose transporter
MTTTKRNNSGAIVIIGILFFIFGFITWLNATLIPYLKISCELTTFESYLVTFAFYISYFVMALPSSVVLNNTGFKNGMSLGLLVMAAGALIFIPAAYTRFYGLFLLGLFIQGTGLALLQTAANPYVTIVGPIESAAKRISIMGVANKVAGIISPIVMGAIVLDNIDAVELKIKSMTAVEKAAELDALAAKVIWPYVIMAVVLVLLAGLIKLSSLPDIKDDDNETAGGNEKDSIFDYPYLWLGALTIFVYVGAEVIAVDTLIAYGKSLGFKLSDAKFFSSFTLVAMIVGYFFGIIAIPKFIKQDKALMLFAAMGVVFTAVALFTTGFTSVLFIAALGFANSIMWPAIWPLAIDGLGRYVKTGSAILIMAIAGGALLPLLYGKLADPEIAGTQTAYVILIPLYLYILFFAAKGHRIGKR